MNTREILLATPRGFCAGVERAIEIVERALQRFGAPIYVRHEVVHNKFVVEDLRTKGAIFVEELDEVPAGSTVIFSAHGVSQQVRDEAARRGLRVFDAAVGGLGGCPYAPGAAGNVATERVAAHLMQAGYATRLDMDKIAAAADFARCLRSGGVDA